MIELAAILFVVVWPPTLIAGVGAVCYWPARLYSWAIGDWS